MNTDSITRDTTVVALSLKNSLLREIEKRAGEDMRTRSNYLQKIIREYLDEHPAQA